MHEKQQQEKATIVQENMDSATHDVTAADTNAIVSTKLNAEIDKVQNYLQSPNTTNAVNAILGEGNDDNTLRNKKILTT